MEIIFLFCANQTEYICKQIFAQICITKKNRANIHIRTSDWFCDISIYFLMSFDESTPCDFESNQTFSR